MFVTILNKKEGGLRTRAKPPLAIYERIKNDGEIVLDRLTPARGLISPARHSEK